MSRPWLAIDPSLRNTGWAYMDEGSVMQVGLIRTCKGSPPVYLDNQKSLHHMSWQLMRVMDEFDTGVVFAEAKGGSKSAKAAAAMASAQGVLVSTCCAKSQELSLILPQAVKKAVCGDRSASKDDIRDAVDELYPGARHLMAHMGYKAKKYNEHIYDAIAIGWAIHKERSDNG